MLKVAIDSGPLKSGHAVRGIGKHTNELIEGLKKLTHKDISLEAFEFANNPEKLLGGSYDVIHYTSFNPYFVSLPFTKPHAKVVLTVHDLIPLIYPKHYPGGLRGSLRLAINKYLIQKNVDVIITISETSKKDICRFLGVTPDKVRVIYLAPRKIFKKLEDKKQLSRISEKYNLPPKFVLYVGDVNYNKNIPNLVRACKIAQIPLVISGKQALEVDSLGIDLINLKGPKDYVRFLFGKPHPEQSHYDELSKEFGYGSKVIRLGYVSDEDLVAIYNLATLYCQPSFYEGFGLPVLEALACGCPVVASKTQALVEIAEGAAVFVDPTCPEKIAEGFKMTVKNPEQPRDYSWEKAARETLRVYEKI
jgi:glycosyltransferase involved in cell wall biosynthesis